MIQIMGGGYKGYIRRIDPENGNEIWKSEDSFDAHNTVGNPYADYEIAFDDNGNVYAPYEGYIIKKVGVEDGKTKASSKIFNTPLPYKWNISGDVAMFYYSGNVYVHAQTSGKKGLLASLKAKDLSENWVNVSGEHVNSSHNVPYYVKLSPLGFGDYYAGFYDAGRDYWYFGGNEKIFVDETGLYKILIQDFNTESRQPFGNVSRIYSLSKHCIEKGGCVRDAQYISQSQEYSTDKGINWSQGLPIKLMPGQDFAVSVKMRNIGQTWWYRNSWWGRNPQNFAQIADLPVLLRSEKSIYRENRWGEWSGPLDVYMYPDISYTPNISADFSTNSSPTIEFGSFGKVWENASKSMGPWRSLITEQSEDSVAPGETATFTQNFTAPTTPGCYEFESWQMSAQHQNGVQWWETSPPTNIAGLQHIEWFGDKTPKGTICVSSEPPCIPDYRCTSAPTSEKCDNTNCDKTITTKKPICIDLKKCTAKDGILSVDVCKSNGVTCPETKTEVCKCSKLPGYNYREVAP